MNRFLLRAKMTEFGDTSERLAEVLGISLSTFNRALYPIQGKRRPFTEFEIAAIAKRYNLTPDELFKVFFVKCRNPSNAQD